MQTRSEKEKEPATRVDHQAEMEKLGFWFKGSVDDAFSYAKKENKTVFIYWGAVWCPPCNELKEQVFSTDRFSSLMKLVVPVYLDGDSEDAQVWSEKLKAAGYPTILAFNPNGQEIMRLVESVSADEFCSTLENAIASSQSFQDIVKAATSGKPSSKSSRLKNTSDFKSWKLLAFYSWADSALDRRPEDIFYELKVLADKAPENLEEERAVLTARFLEMALQVKDSQDIKAIKQLALVLRKHDQYFEAIFRSPRAIFAARTFVIYSGKDIGELFLKGKKDQEKVAFISRWLAAAKTIREYPSASVDTKLWSWYPEIQFYEFLHPQKRDLPQSLQKSVMGAVAVADSAARSKFERHAVISGAADLLIQINDFEGARALLLKELKHTDTPWYYESGMANLEERAGKTEEALAWAEKAKTSAAGRATKIQWIVSSLVMNTKLSHKNQEQDIARVLAEYYETALGLSDGFSGRNAARSKSVTKNLKPWAQKSLVKNVIDENYKKCLSAKDDTLKLRCQSHFKELL